MLHRIKPDKVNLNKNIQSMVRTTEQVFATQFSSTFGLSKIT